MTHTLVAQQTTSGTGWQGLFERLKKVQPSAAKGLKQTKSSLSAIKTSNTITKKCYTVKTPCSGFDGTYTTAIVWGEGSPLYIGGGEQQAMITYFPDYDMPGWYFIKQNGDLFFNNASPEALPLDGWVYAEDGCGTEGEPASLTFTETTCETLALCREVKTDCGTFGGQYKQGGTFYGKPFFSKDDLSHIILFQGDNEGEGGGWMIFSGFAGPPSAIAESNDDLPPATGWMVLDLACEEDAQITVKSCGCTPEPVNALNSLVFNTLSASNCPINLRFPAYGSMAVITGPNNYVYSSVYRKPGPYLMNINGIKKPGTYTVTVSAANECGEITSKVVTFVVNGQGCN